MATNEAFAPAKVNLALHVTGQRGDGYHLLDSLVVFADVGDRLRFEPAQVMSLEVTGPFSGGVPDDARNLVWRAAELAGQRLNIRLEKNLPHGAGLGGGSSDAAAVLRTFKAPEPAAALGADVPVCLAGTPQRMQGVGDRLTPVVAMPECHLVLVHPGVNLATPEVFSALEDKENPGLGDIVNWGSQPEFVGWLQNQRNDLETAAIGIAPVIADVLNALSDAPVARMSGSGAACFGLYPDRPSAQLAARRIASERPAWWVRCVRTAGLGPDQRIAR